MIFLHDIEHIIGANAKETNLQQKQDLVVYQ